MKSNGSAGLFPFHISLNLSRYFTLSWLRANWFILMEKKKPLIKQKKKKKEYWSGVPLPSPRTRLPINAPNDNNCHNLKHLCKWN